MTLTTITIRTHKNHILVSVQLVLQLSHIKILNIRRRKRIKFIVLDKIWCGEGRFLLQSRAYADLELSLNSHVGDE
jgi:hypothetical protein